VKGACPGGEVLGLAVLTSLLEPLQHGMVTPVYSSCGGMTLCNLCLGRSMHTFPSSTLAYYHATKLSRWLQKATTSCGYLNVCRVVFQRVSTP
jgi:hypothetical protein